MSHVRHFRHLRFWASCGLLAVLLVGALGAPGFAAPPDPVEELRQGLLTQSRDERNEAALKFRRENLPKLIAAIKTIGDMRKALTLSEWKDLSTSREIQVIDQSNRQRLGENFMAAVKTVVAKGDTTSRLAVAALLGEMTTDVRALDPADRSGFGRGLAPILVGLLQDRDGEVRAAAARALGKVNPVPSATVAALKILLAKGSIADRRAAADALVSLVQVPARLRRVGTTQTGVLAFDEDIIDAAKEVIATAALPLKDSDVQVRRIGITALLQATAAFRELVFDAVAAKDFPAKGRDRTPDEEKIIRAYQKTVLQEQANFKPLIQTAQDQARTLAQALTDTDSEVQEKARQALEMYGSARLRLRRRIASVELPPAADELILAIAPALKVVQQGVRDPNVQVRRSTLDFLESLEENAAPAIPGIVAALSDPDRFVRWAAARTLGKIGPIRIELTVPALARLLRDPDLDVSLVAENTLKSFGADAKAAVPDLIAATRVGDAEARVAALQTLASVGVADAASSIPAVIDALGNTDARVRRTAAETLGSFGRSASAAVLPLRQLLQDEDAEVRRAASDALLSIQPIGK
ncbi:MAG TPA: HEAT repeat domain-containing protein [Gemmataceae bacterium]|nr:HEAT repeat domain-containing protein [Gemmataceae bacterium]